MLTPEASLPLDALHPLIVVFGEFVPTTCQCELSNSLISTHSNYFPQISSQTQSLPRKGVLWAENSHRHAVKGLQTGDLPSPSITTDRFTPQYLFFTTVSGFSTTFFDDVFHQRRLVPGEDSIIGAKLWNEVNTFADRMADFYDGSEGWIHTIGQKPGFLENHRLLALIRSLLWMLSLCQFRFSPLDGSRRVREEWGELGRLGSRCPLS